LRGAGVDVLVKMMVHRPTLDLQYKKKNYYIEHQMWAKVWSFFGTGK